MRLMKSRGLERGRVDAVAGPPQPAGNPIGRRRVAGSEPENLSPNAACCSRSAWSCRMMGSLPDWARSVSANAAPATAVPAAPRAITCSHSRRVVGIRRCSARGGHPIADCGVTCVLRCAGRDESRAPPPRLLCMPTKRAACSAFLPRPRHGRQRPRSKTAGQSMSSRPIRARRALSTPAPMTP